MATMPTRVDGALFDAAKAAGELHSRSAAQQLARWARIGRELESSPAVTHEAISPACSPGERPTASWATTHRLSCASPGTSRSPSEPPGWTSPSALAVARVAYRVAEGGHAVPEHEIRERHRRLWELVAQARPVAHRAYFYDNSRANGFARVAHFELGLLVGTPAWPAWTPAAPLAPSGEASGERRTI